MTLQSNIEERNIMLKEKEKERKKKQLRQSNSKY